jgi:hypothetical protein
MVEAPGGVNRSILCRRSRSRASAWLTPSRTVTRLSLVINALAGTSSRVSKRMSRFVRMPQSVPFASTTGKPEIFRRALIWRTSLSRVSGLMVSGLMTIPLS